jgi:putative oligomerization/nucleic acid binding protein
LDTLVCAPAPAGTVDQASVVETRTEIGQMDLGSATSLWKLSKMGKQLKELNLAQAREGQNSVFASQVIVLGSGQPAQPAQPAQLAPGRPAPSTVDRLAELSELHDRGRLTDEEFAQAKKLLLGE